ncbi:hypothetical protein BJX76DRAFT_361289 [Aspergillus varians]
MLYEHLSNNPSEKNRLDEVILQALLDLSTYHEMLASVRFHRPQNTPKMIQEVRKTEDRPSWTTVNIPHDPSYLQRIGVPLIKDFYLVKPPTDPKTAATLARSRASCAALERFWESIRGIVQKDLYDSGHKKAEADSILEVVSVNLSREYLEGRQRKEDEILAAINESSNRSQPVPDFVSGDQGDSVPAVTIPRREKTKTRGEQRPSTDDTTPVRNDAPGAHAETIEEVRATTLKVTKKSLEVFLLMFPGPHDAVKDVLWDRFVHAMVDAGFTARNNSGSAVSLGKSDGEGGSIVFH